MTTVAASFLGLRRYDRTKVDGLTMTSAQIDRVICDYLALGPEGRRADPRIGRERHALIMSGAAMVMIMPPYHGATFRVGEPAIYEFYRVVSDAIGIPIMIQDAPAAGTPLSAPFLARMAKRSRTSPISRSRSRRPHPNCAR